MICNNAWFLNIGIVNYDNKIVLEYNLDEIWLNQKVLMFCLVNNIHDFYKSLNFIFSDRHMIYLFLHVIHLQM